MNITLSFLLQNDTLPSVEEQVDDLWKVAKLLEPFGFPIVDWYPGAGTPKKSLEHPAFDRDGPTPVALKKFRLKDKKDATTEYHFRRMGVWNGKTKTPGCVFSTLFSADVDNPVCLLHLLFYRVEAFVNTTNMRGLLIGLLDIWPTAYQIQAGPLIYYTTHKVFPKRPGAGWMLYLAETITDKTLPEAAELVQVMQGDKQRGTLIVSVADAVFSVANPEHLNCANAIETRLADQDLLPR